MKTNLDGSGPVYFEYKMTFDVSGGTTVLTRFFRLLSFPFRYVLFGKWDF